MKVEIYTHVYNQLKKLAEANRITITTLASSLLDRMLHNHKKETDKIIESLKVKTKNVL